MKAAVFLLLALVAGAHAQPTVVTKPSPAPVVKPSPKSKSPSHALTHFRPCCLPDALSSHAPCPRPWLRLSACNLQKSTTRGL